jgi:hypothetical protein
MKQRTNTYLGTFVNSPEGISSYKLMVKNVRNTVTGGRFVKMFRGNSRRFHEWTDRNGKTHRTYNGTAKKEGSTHFDVYLLSRVETNSFGDWFRSEPKFFNFKLGH